jgi:antitoxin component YwqK of YwqJK toxin-antitoxin module
MTDTLSPSAALSAAPSSAASAPDARASVVDERDASGATVSRTSLLNGVPHGETVRYGPHGLPLLEANFEHGALCGPMRVFDVHGALVQESHYMDGKLHGVTTMYQDGRIASRQHHMLGVLHGESVCYAPSGLLTSRTTYEAGRLEREALFMHDGVIVRRARYSHDVLEGETRDYASDGMLVQSSPYRANLLHGTVRRFGPDGQLMQERRYLHGKPQGEWRSVDAAAPHDATANAAPRLVKHLEKWVRG